jgi:hypothetical protein
MKKERRFKVLSTSPGFYTKEELDAIHYFHGQGFYAKQQDQTFKPNIYDIRQSFLLKMHDPVVRQNFINSYKRLNSVADTISIDDIDYL